MRVPEKHAFTTMFLLLAVSGGCRRGPDMTATSGATSRAATKPTAKVVRPAPEEGLLRLRTVRAFREWGVRETAADALARIGDPAVPALIETLRDPDPSIRAQAAKAFARMGPKAAPAVPELILALNDDEREVRQGAARALGQIGSGAEEAVPALIKSLKDPRNKPVVEPVETEVVVPERVVD